MLPEEDLKKPLRVTFVGEEGVDEGGVQKEYFQVCIFVHTVGHFPSPQAIIDTGNRLPRESTTTITTKAGHKRHQQVPTPTVFQAACPPVPCCCCCCC